MPIVCTSCFSNLTLFKRKSKCRFCLRIFCISCLVKEKICEKCDLIFINPIKENLMKMKTKELIFYLDLLKISFTNCVEKEELVNLLIINVSKMKPAANSSSGRSFDDMNANFEQIRNRCQNLFTSLSDRLKSGGDASTRTTASNSSSFYTFPESDVRENKQDFQKQNSLDNESKNSKVVNKSSALNAQQSPERPQPGTSKSFNSTRRVNTSRSENHSREQSPLWMRNNEIHSNDTTISNDKIRLKLRSNSDSNLIDKIQNESSLINVPKKKSCDNCGKIRTKVKLKLCYALQQLEKVQPNTDSVIGDVKEILSETLESFDHHTSYSNQSSPSSSLDSSLSIIPMPEISLDERNQGSLTPEEAVYESVNSTANRNVQIDSNAFQGTIIEVGRQTSLSPIEPVMASTNSMQAKRFFTLDDVKSKEDLEDLSVKQLKEILSINRVNFKGCCEKNELKERVVRLWDDHVSSLPVEKLPNEDLCKICFSSSVSCAFLECGHSCTCIDCGKVLSECPVCRQYIIRVLRIFKS